MKTCAPTGAAGIGCKCYRVQLVIGSTVFHQLIYACDNCDFKSKNKRSFKFHQLRHSVGKFPCDECDFKGITNAFLRNHALRKHKGLRNKCDLCTYTSVTKLSMKDQRTTV